MRNAAGATVKGVQVGQSAEACRYADQSHALSAAWATRRRWRGIVVAFVAHDANSVLSRAGLGSDVCVAVSDRVPRFVHRQNACSKNGRDAQIGSTHYWEMAEGLIFGNRTCRFVVGEQKNASHGWLGCEQRTAMDECAIRTASDEFNRMSQTSTLRVGSSDLSGHHKPEAACASPRLAAKMPV